MAWWCALVWSLGCAGSVAQGGAPGALPTTAGAGVGDAPGVSQQANGSTQVASSPKPALGGESPDKTPTTDTTPSAGSSAREASDEAAASGSAGFDLKAWLKQHRVTIQPPKNAQCEAAQIGNPPTDALLCHEPREMPAAPLPANVSPEAVPVPRIAIGYAVIYVPAGQALRKALEVPVEAARADWVNSNSEQNVYAKLAIDIDSDGVLVTVTDDPYLGCGHGAEQQAHLAADPDTKHLVGPVKKAVDPVCGARGRYAYRGGSFVRQAAPATSKKR